jgi:predicted O-linked N-acetylglucosamine transferase (SPINDLY family)
MTKRTGPKGSAKRNPATGPSVSRAKMKPITAKKSPNSLQRSQMLDQALALQHQGKPDEAAEIFEQVLVHEPNDVRALYSLAVIANARKNLDRAFELLQAVVRLAPRFMLGQYALASVLQGLGRIADSVEPLRRVLQLEPGHAEAAERLARAQQALMVGVQVSNDPGLALGAFRPARVPKVPGVASAGSGLQGVMTEAERSQAQAPPAGVPPWLLEAFQLKDQGQHVEARLRFERLLTSDPENLIALFALCEIAMAEGKTEFALHFATRAIRKDPNQPRAHFSRGSVLQSMGLYEAALASFDEALKLKPDLVEGWNNRTHVLHAMHRNAEALLSVEKALAIRPDDLKALANRGYLLSGYKRHAEAADMYERQLAIDPDYEYAAGLLAFARMHACDWQGYEKNRQRVLDGVKLGKRACNPLAFFAISDDPLAQRQCVETFARHRFPMTKPLWQGERYRHRRPRIGYVSADFREHPVGHLMTGIIEQHDKRRFEVFGISLGIDDGSAHRKRFKQGFDHFIDCRERTSAETAQIMRAMELDLVIDLGGYTSDARPDIFAMRPAPIQVNYLGFPGTMGMPFMDYILADGVVIPEGDEAFYQEKVLRLPCCYLPIDDTIKPAEQPPSRTECGLPEHGVVFCSFNHDYKINPAMWAMWMDLLRQHPGSVLWLMKLHEDAMTNLRAQAQAYDIDPGRVVFATRVPRIEDHLARYRLADVFLDTTPYNAHSTATDVLRAGARIVTLSGRSFASRVAGSVINHMGAHESKIVYEPAKYQEAVNTVLNAPRSEQQLLKMPSARQHCQAMEEVLWGTLTA